MKRMKSRIILRQDNRIEPHRVFNDCDNRKADNNKMRGEKLLVSRHKMVFSIDGAL